MFVLTTLFVIQTTVNVNIVTFNMTINILKTLFFFLSYVYLEKFKSTEPLNGLFYFQKLAIKLILNPTF